MPTTVAYEVTYYLSSHLVFCSFIPSADGLAISYNYLNMGLAYLQSDGYLYIRKVPGAQEDIFFMLFDSLSNVGFCIVGKWNIFPRASKRKIWFPFQMTGENKYFENIR
jgi:hypothetical protein